MKKWKIILVVLFVIITALTVLSRFYRQVAVDDTPPVLTCTQDVLEVSVDAGRKSCFREFRLGTIETAILRVKLW